MLGYFSVAVAVFGDDGDGGQHRSSDSGSGSNGSAT